MTSAAPQEEFARELERLGAERADLMARITEIRATPAQQNQKDLTAFVDQEVRKFVSLGNQADKNIKTVSDKQSDAAMPLRQFKVDNGVSRPAKETNLVKTIAVLQSAFVIEAGATAGLLASDGVMELLPALLTGAAFAGTNIALGVTTGCLGLRGMAHRIDAPEPKPRDRLVRRLSAGISSGAAAIMMGLHFAAARVRVIGDHADIWNWEKISFAGTFADYNALTLMAIGGVSSVLAVYEGRNGIADPVWGYSELTKVTEDDIRNALDRALDDGEKRLEAAFENAAETVETSTERHEEARNDRLAELSALREDVGRFNADVQHTVSGLKVLQKNDLSRREYIGGPGRKVDQASFDLAGMRGLLIDESLIPTSAIQPLEPEPLIARLDAAFEDARGKLGTAHTTATSFITLPFIS